MRTTIAASMFCIVIGVSFEARAQFTNYLDGATLPGDAGWTVDGEAGTIVDLGGGNSGIQSTDDGGGYDEFYLTIFDTSNTLATRFRVDSYSGSDITPLLLTAGGNIDSGGIGLGIRDIGGMDRWALVRFFPDPDVVLLDVAPVVLGEFNEALIHIDATTDVVRFSWNGVELYNAVTPTDWDSDEGYAEWGASTYWGQGGTSTATFDWVGYGPGYVPEPGSLLLAALGGLGLLALLRRRIRH